ncbi:MAG: hypothetical protein WA996_02020, partial [Candidatus Promineifilaceae bacterium]
YGQPSPIVRTVTYYGLDNQIDGIVLEVLLRKHKAIRTSLGISVPIPANTSDVVQALMEGMLLRGSDANAGQLAFDYLNDPANTIHLDWETTSNREHRSRTMFAQHAMKVDEVFPEWQAIREAVGTGEEVERFVSEVVEANGGFVSKKNGRLVLHMPNKAAMREIVDGREKLSVRFALPVSGKEVYLTRTHPIVEGLATYTMDTTLDPLLDGVAKRSGVIRTKEVEQATTILLLRYRQHIVTKSGEGETPLLAEACEVVAFTGRTDSPQWLEDDQVQSLLHAIPDANVPAQQATQFLQRVLGGFESLQPELDARAEQEAQTLLAAHRRVRTASRLTGERYSVRPQLPPDVLGMYLLLPVVT